MTCKEPKISHKDKETENSKDFQEERKEFNEKKHWSTPELQKVEKLEVLDI